MKSPHAAARTDKYKWIALSNTTLGVLIATIDGSIVIISMPAIFRGIGLDPLAQGNIGYLLWLILGYLLVSAVAVVSLGRLGDMYGRVKMYNLGFLVFTLASIALSVDPFKSQAGALWLIGFRVIQAIGGSMLTANSAAILTDSFPESERGMALGTNQIAALAGQFIGLLLGGLLSTIDWRAVFWVNVPVGIFGTIWSYRSLRDTGERRRARVDWQGNITFTAGVSIILAAITYGIQPDGAHPNGWTNPWVIGGLVGGVALLVAFCVIEARVLEPMFSLALFRIRIFAAGNVAVLLVAVARGGLQFMLIIWLQGIWLPLHGYAFSETPFWAGIYLLPLTLGVLVSAPIAGRLSDRYGARYLASGGLALVALSFVGLLLLPVSFNYLDFALLLVLSGIGQGMFSAPNTAEVMSSVPPAQRGVASGMRSTFQNAGSSLSIGIFFSLMTAGLARALPTTLAGGLEGQNVPPDVAAQVAHLPPVSTLFAAFLGENPVAHLLSGFTVLQTLPSANVDALTSTTFFPGLIAAPFSDGLLIVFASAALMSAIAAAVSLMRKKRTERPVASPSNTAIVP